ncbi:MULTISPECIES: bifunctional folylpolyglutamate synthase/dihydrofolate synthase [unclassified Sphingomonas]|uniref:bifunctional folylpolyglutamate synthase/dihydrofolate synthase n=1 Tax=unclassified Sphingomonas TaxID=196159 RepID=UPI0006FA3AC7|nr:MULTISPECIES: bifunctional folylpolyglutamate synthase/dihydrofolate synthase [unclassified Sphingomonas]KQS49084.1 bifunctional folylpolyglutamate synthase/dihydrofolate synthase [Sphingomonas sp. Leaf198]
MPDHATSSSPAVQAQLDRLTALSPGADILGLERITALLSRLGDPHLNLPPVFHVAGTNGKGSTCAFLRAAIEAAGHSVHVYSSPHLVRFNERIRLAGKLIEDDLLAALLSEVLDHAADLQASFFEVTTAAAFLAFARTPAAATIVEVGLGGRLDATNVIPNPVVTGIAALGIDHQSFLGDTLLEIAGEKAGIAKAGVPLVTMDYPKALRANIAAIAAAAGAPVVARGTAWTSETARSTVRYEDTGFSVVTNRPRLVGAHQSRNLALAIAMLRNQGALHIPEAAMRAAADWAQWPARMQRLSDGPLLARLPAGSELWLDGAHNPNAAKPVERTLRRIAQGRPVTLVMGMLANKDADAVLRILSPSLARIIAIPVEGHAHHAPHALVEIAARYGVQGDVAPGIADALDRLSTQGPSVVLIAGSLYIAGEALVGNDQPPD